MNKKEYELIINHLEKELENNNLNFEVNINSDDYDIIRLVHCLEVIKENFKINFFKTQDLEDKRKKNIEKTNHVLRNSLFVLEGVVHLKKVKNETFFSSEEFECIEKHLMIMENIITECLSDSV